MSRAADRLLPSCSAEPEKPRHARISGAALELYSRYCVQCHGVNGDGNGVAATYMIPKPRNYQMGIFKFTSTSYGSKPLREDLLRTVRRGVRGTSMPAFPLLPPKDLEAVVDYVQSLTRRGELETKLAEQAEFDEQIDRGKAARCGQRDRCPVGRGAG